MFEDIRTKELIEERIEYENSFISQADIHKSEEMDFQIKEYESFLYSFEEDDFLMKLRDDQLIAERLEYEKNLEDFLRYEEPIEINCNSYIEAEMMDIGYDEYPELDDYYFEEINMDAAYCGNSLRGFVVSDDPYDSFTEYGYPEGPNENIDGFRFEEPQFKCFDIPDYPDFEPDYECFEIPDFEEEYLESIMSDKEESYITNQIKEHLEEERQFINFIKDSEMFDEAKLQFESEGIILC